MLSCLSLENQGLSKDGNFMWNNVGGKEMDVYYRENSSSEIQLLPIGNSNCLYDDFVTDEDEFESDDDDDDKWNDEPESPATLLAFAESATNDIRHFFNRNRGNDDYCDVYEDKFKSVKSGRELYYADLLAELGSDRKRVKRQQKCCSVSIPSEHTITTPNGKTVKCHLPHLGRLDVNYGLGPFQELFDSVLRKSLIQDSHREPITKFQEVLWDDTKHQQTLDFDDLLADWTSDNPGYDVVL